MVTYAVALAGVENPGNLGAVARAMANFGVKELLLLYPQCKVDHIEAINRAKHAKGLLQAATVVKDAKKAETLLGEFDIVVGLTAKLSDDYNLQRTPLLPGQLVEKLADYDASARVALLFGKESDGLTNEELSWCDFTVTIPTSLKYPSLNLSHAVAVMLFVLCSGEYSINVTEKFPLVKAPQKQQLRKMVTALLERLPFATEEKQETQEILWRRLIGKSMLTQREAMALLGFFRKVEYVLPKSSKKR